MKDKLFQWVWLLSGLLLLVVGIVAIFHPEGTVRSLSYLLAVLMIFSAVLSLVAYHKLKSRLPRSGWLLTDGIVSLLVALPVLFHEWIASRAILIFFGMWIIFSGIDGIMNALDFRQAKLKNWVWLILAGVLETAAGIWILFNPGAAAAALSVIIGTALILNGGATVFLWIYSRELYR